MRKIIAVSGFKGSGKDTLANYLIDNVGYRRVAFADPLKDMASEQFGIYRTAFDDPRLKERPLLQYPAPAIDGFTTMLSKFLVRELKTKHGFPADTKHVREQDGVLQTFLLDKWESLYHTPRSLAILVGSSMRAGSSDFWVQKAIEKINCDQTYDKFVISDLRYKSEIIQLKAEFGQDLLTVRVNRFENTNSTDPSELDVVGVPHDLEISNKGTFNEFENNIKELLK